jgi:porphobilinogen synthase
MADLIHRPRRLRKNRLLRDMVAETRLDPDCFIQPYFVCEGISGREEISSMPGIFRESPDTLLNTIRDDMKLGISRIMLFGVPAKKDSEAKML